VPARERGPRLRAAVDKALALSGASVLVAARGQEDRFYSTARACPGCGAGLPVPDPRLFTFSQKFGACPACDGRGCVVEAGDEDEGEEAAAGRDGPPCPACRGTRLRPEALAVRVAGRSIGEI